MNPEQRIEELSRQIEHYNFRYYQDSVSEISDFDFDKLLRELKDLEDKHPEFRKSDSPTQRVGGTITKNFSPARRHIEAPGFERKQTFFMTIENNIIAQKRI